MKPSTLLAVLLTGFTLIFSGNVSANLLLADGGTTGQWFNLERDGEGLFVEVVIRPDGSQAIAISWFTYDQFGEQMWLSGIQDIGDTDTIANVSVSVTDGPIFGPDYDKNDLNSEFWGTIELTFLTCDSGSMVYTSSIGFGAGSIPLSRLTTVTNVNCMEPPLEINVTPGKWVGPGVCFYVAEDGLSVTSTGSTCPAGRAFSADLTGEQLTGNLACTVTVDCNGTFAISPGQNEDFPEPYFDCGGVTGLAAGTFAQPDAAGGIGFDREDGSGGCTAVWGATPEQ
jgi:hypothetical protein